MDQNSNVVARHDYLPFGEEISGFAGRTTAGFTVTGDWTTQRFTGQIRDQESGEDFFNARYFSAPLGRFNSVDPGNAGASLGSSQSWNGYGYVLGNPLGLVDPSGMYAEVPPTVQTAPSDFCTTFITGQEGVTPAANPCTGGMFSMAYSGALPIGGQRTGSSNSGSAATSGGSPAKNVAQIPPLAQSAVAQAPKACLAAVGGSSNAAADAARLGKSAAGIRWYDGRNLSNSQFPSVPRGTANATTVPTAGNIPTSNVILWSGFWSENVSGQIGTLWHEITHVFTKLDDAHLVDKFQILQKLNPYGRPYPSYLPDSQNYDDWLNRDRCP